MMRKMLAIPVAGALLSVGLVTAQDRPIPTKPGQSQEIQRQPGQVQPGQKQTVEGADRATRPMTDQTLAACAVIDNQAEVAVATMARDKVQHEDVRKFAGMLIEDHQAFLTKLEKFAPGAASQKLEDGNYASRAKLEQTSTNSPRANQTPGTTPRTTPGTTPDTPSGIRQVSGTQTAAQAHDGQAADQVVQIQREIAQECLQAAKKELQSKQGVELDQCFLGHQIAMHAGMIARLTVFQRHASDDLAQVFAQGVETAEKHKEEAEKLMKKLDTSNPNAAQRRTERKENREERRESN